MPWKNLHLIFYVLRGDARLEAWHDVNATYVRNALETWHFVYRGNMTDFSSGCLQFIAFWCICESESAWGAENALRGNVSYYSMQWSNHIFSLLCICKHYIFFESYFYVDPKKQSWIPLFGNKSTLPFCRPVVMGTWVEEWFSPYFLKNIFFTSITFDQSANFVFPACKECC